MTCDRGEDRTLLLSRGLFGAPTGREERAPEMRPLEARERPEREESGRSG